jgi:hypothetical protein
MRLSYKLCNDVLLIVFRYIHRYRNGKIVKEYKREFLIVDDCYLLHVMRVHRFSASRVCYREYRVCYREYRIHNKLTGYRWCEYYRQIRNFKTGYKMCELPKNY